MDNLMVLHFSGFHPKHIKTAIPYEQALRIHRICSDEEERDGHLKVLKDTLKGIGYDAQLIDHHKLPSLQGNIDYNTAQACHGDLCKAFKIFNMDTTIT
eukprot:g22159.t1